MKTKWWNLAAAICMGTVVSGTTVRAQEETPLPTLPDNSYTLLQVNLKPGTSYNVRQKMHIKVSLNMAVPNTKEVHKMELWLDMIQDMQYKSLYRLPDGGTRLRVQYGKEQVGTKASFDGRLMQVDRMEEGNTRPRTGNIELEMTVSPTGKTTDIRGLDKLWKQTFSGDEGLTSEQKRQAETQMKKLLGNDMMKNIMEQSGIAYPEHALRIGQAWHYSYGLKQPYAIRLNLSRTLKNVENDIATLSDTGGVAFGDGKPISFGGSSFDLNLKGNYAGTSQVEVANGFVGSTRGLLRFGGRLSVEDPASKVKVSIPAFCRVNILTTVEAAK